MVNKKIANREVCDLIFLDYATKIPVLNVDYANVSTTELTGETEYARAGRGNARKIAFYGEKGGSISFECQIQPFKLHQIMTGGKLSNTAKYLKRKVLKSSTKKITIPDVDLVAGTVNVFALDDDCGTPIEITVSESTVTLPSEATDGDYVVYYFVNKTSGVQRISIKDTTFPKTLVAQMSTIDKSEDDEILPYKMIAYKIAPNNNISLSFSNSGAPANLSFSAELMSDEDGNMLDMILLEDEDDE